MITVKLRYFSNIADLTGQRAEERVLPEGASLADLIRVLSAGYAPLAAYLATEKRQSPHPLRIFVNGQAVTGSRQMLADGDSVRIFPIISGG